VIILRFFFVYGPGQRKTMLIPRLVDSIKKGAPINLNGKYGLSINPIYVSDAVNAVNGALNINRSEIMNIAGKETLNLKEICNKIGKQLNKQAQFITNSNLPRNIIGDISKMRNLLGEPKVSFQDGVSYYIKSLS
jgi:nucleoside-diphosphate-sugar epimerase